MFLIIFAVKMNSMIFNQQKNTSKDRLKKDESGVYISLRAHSGIQTKTHSKKQAELRGTGKR